eukprot:245906_1
MSLLSSYVPFVALGSAVEKSPLSRTVSVGTMLSSSSSHQSLSSLDDIEYSNYTRSSRQGIKRRRRHRRGSKNKRKVPNKFIHSVTDTCAVCLDDSTRLDTKLFPCGHSFHGQCLIQWVTINHGSKFNCPLCRQDIAHFVQMSGNQELTDELIQIWNDHYLYNKREHAEAPKPSKCTLKPQTQNIKLTAPSVPIASPTCHKPCTDPIDIPPPNEMNVAPPSDRVASTDCSIWKYIWTLALYPTTTHRNILAPTVSSVHNICDDTLSDIYVNEENDSPYLYHVSSTDRMGPMFRKNQIPQIPTETNHVDAKELTEINSTASTSDVLSFDVMNFKSGACAGICAGATTFIIAEQLRQGAFRRSLFPILAETIPNVAIFFTSYEHLKRYLFAEDSVNNGWYQTFAQRFLSAGIASSVACFIGSGSAGAMRLLPLRYATFFGCFELCKDLVNKDHETLNLASVATGAAMGGIVSHSVYYPLVQYKNMSLVQVSSLDGVASGTKSILYKNMYRGFVSSLNKFLPPCVVCSCAFEYSKRYFRL